MKKNLFIVLAIVGLAVGCGGKPAPKCPIDSNFLTVQSDFTSYYTVTNDTGVHKMQVELWKCVRRNNMGCGNQWWFTNEVKF